MLLLLWVVVAVVALQAVLAVAEVEVAALVGKITSLSFRAHRTPLWLVLPASETRQRMVATLTSKTLPL